VFVTWISRRVPVVKAFLSIAEMAQLYKALEPASQYRDNQSRDDWEKHQESLKKSTTLYIGNLSFFTTEEQIHELFSKCGEIKRIVMGLDKFKKTPCGFCFVEFYNHQDAADCVSYINGTKLDDRVIRVDWDSGFKEGRQYGRGKTGGQVRDEYRTDFDPGRGGFGKQLQSPFQSGAGGPPGADGGPAAASAAMAAMAAAVAAGIPFPAIPGVPTFPGVSPQQQRFQGGRGGGGGRKRDRDEGNGGGFQKRPKESSPQEKNPRFSRESKEKDEEEMDT